MLEELRLVAQAEGRSVSAQIIHPVRRDLEMRARGTTVAARRRKITADGDIAESGLVEVVWD